eukprot:scaffold4357_cov113-Isochrysis_galbana.AAC.1
MGDPGIKGEIEVGLDWRGSQQVGQAAHNRRVELNFSDRARGEGEAVQGEGERGMHRSSAKAKVPGATAAASTTLRAGATCGWLLRARTCAVTMMTGFSVKGSLNLSTYAPAPPALSTPYPPPRSTRPAESTSPKIASAL